MTNRLADATSPYLLQHADNPVDWWPWSDEAFANARERDVPVLLSVGYAACHWCHVMAHESFEDQGTAALINANFVPIKVDREERPDVDAVYMEATQAMAGQGGWPMTCFLTPAGAPFHCGTYYPPAPRQGMPSFSQLLTAVAQAWRERRDEIIGVGDQVVKALAEQQGPLPEAAVDAAVLDGAVTSLLGDFDRRRGGFGSAPKFPPSMVLEFLLRHHDRTGNTDALSMAEATLAAMARGGMYDQLGGGFARYSVDADWIVPHFEKMLYDNALLLRVYAHLARRTGSALARRVAAETAAFLLGPLRTPQGAFAAALDADTDGVEGLTYVWTPAQLTEVLGPDDGPWAADVFEVTDEGNFEHGASTLRLLADPPDPARYSSVRARLLAARQQRPQPALDDKVVTAWNGLAITALAEAGVALGQPDWVTAATEAAGFLLDTHLVDGRLRRTSRHGTVGPSAGVLDDYGCLADGLLAVHQATGETRWLDAATALLDTALDQFADPDTPGAFHDTAADAERLVRRPADPSDNATPAGASALTAALLTAAALTGPDPAGAPAAGASGLDDSAAGASGAGVSGPDDSAAGASAVGASAAGASAAGASGRGRADRYRSAAEAALTRVGLLVARAPRFAGHWCSAAEAMLSGPIQIAVVGAPDDPRRAALVEAAIAAAPGGAVLQAGQPDSTPLLADRPLVANAPAAYVCRGYLCDRPVTTPAALTTALTP